MSDVGPIDPGYGAESALLSKWSLRPDGEPLTTPSSRVIPVRTADGVPAMLKLSRIDEERRGGALLLALDGRGAARVLRCEGDALLIERATGPQSLVGMVHDGDDADELATRILCAAGDRIHESSDDLLNRTPPLDLVPLDDWFRLLFAHADDLEPAHRRGADLALALLAHPRDRVVLHGDLHHGNVLDFGERGWLAIDPKGLVGESAFDRCNLLCNPSHSRALDPGRLERRFGVVVESTGLDAVRYARWVAAWGALSSTWFALDGDERHARGALEIGERALALSLAA
ncbi:3'-kinase [Agromyces protaetiae]|uniref:3'-kinase n=1 Tax=Agromyces protaetiae TaxID=2509455 RepID=A0A4P6FVX0_9MICO|nr:aminoglycoside phosphotransferase family protein [Agromyces protaetiae]QAY74768.1 3'-kinase [Agromyces protaetiae]